MNVADVTPGIFCRNEEYWIGYVLRDLCAAFPEVVVLDTGSTDGTLGIIRSFSNVRLLTENYGDDPHKIGNSPNVLRDAIKTYWMLLLAGDEVLRKEQLDNLRNVELPPTTKVAMILGHNVGDVEGRLVQRTDDFFADKFFWPGVRWTATEYPFEGYGQHLLNADELYHIPGNQFHYWHVRNCKRSRLDDSTYFRKTKMSYYPYPGHIELPSDWLGEAGNWPSPYFNGGVH